MSKPTCRELLTDLWADADEVVRRHLSDQEKLHQAYQLAARVERVLALHHPVKQKYGGPDYCAACVPSYPKIELWPCPTVRRLNGEDT